MRGAGRGVSGSRSLGAQSTAGCTPGWVLFLSKLRTSAWYDQEVVFLLCCFSLFIKNIFFQIFSMNYFEIYRKVKETQK